MKRRRHANTDRPTAVTRPLSRATPPPLPSRSRGGLVATSYHRGREIRVYEAGGGYYVEADGATGAPGPFRTIAAAVERGKSLIDPMRYASRQRGRRPRKRGR